MNDPTPTDPRHPRLQMRGPRADVPAVGGDPSLPYASAGAEGEALPYAGTLRSPKRKRRGALVGLVALVLVGAGVASVSLAGGGDDDEPVASAPAPGPDTTDRPSTPTTDATSQTTEATSQTTDATSQTTLPATTAPATTTPATTAPPTTTTVSPTANIPVDQLPRHEAVYRDGKLILQGTLPSQEVADRFRDKAAAVIGPDNVIVRYQFDPRVPAPTDGRVRVDDDFLFPKGSAAIDPRYEPLMGLGVAVMKLNPQARMRILGYTDDSGRTEVNAALSQARADALKNFLALNGIDRARVDALGRGEVDFVAPNDTEANRGLNRRIEVELVNLLAG